MGGVRKRNILSGCAAHGRTISHEAIFLYAAIIQSLFLWLLFFPTQIFSQPLQSQPRVLLLNAYHQGFRWTDELTQAVIQVFQTQMPQAEVHIEYMDSKRQYNQALEERIIGLLQSKYQSTPPDIIITADDAALNLVIKLHSTLFARIPVVFCGVNNINAARQVPRDWFTGTVESLDIGENIALALRLFPETREIVVLSDGTPTGLGTRQETSEQEKNFPQIQFHYLNGEDLSTEAMLIRLHGLKKHSVVLAPAWYKDSLGKSYTNTESYTRIAQASPVPVFVMSSANIGLGVLGGRVNSGAGQGAFAARQAIRMLKGEATAASLPVALRGSNTYLFDSRQLTRFGLSENQLPPGSTVLFRPFSFYKAYKILVWVVAAAFSVFVVLILILLVSIHRLRLTRGYLARSEDQLRVTLHSIGDAVIATDTQGNITAMNPVAEALTGWSFTEAQGQSLSLIMILADSTSRAPRPSPLDAVLATGSVVTLERDTLLIARDGSEYQVADSGAPIKNDDGKVLGMVLVFRDVTEELAAERKRYQSQRLEAIGQLAGGVAHDFNNMLCGIIGSAEMLSLKLGKEHSLQPHVQLIIKASENAAALTRKLLAFSRKDTLIKGPIDVHESLVSAQSLLERSLDKSITMKNRFKASASTIEGDPAEIENAIINICVNASQAMNEGGVLTLATENVELDPAYCEASPFTLEPGLFIRIDIDDTGVGMEPEVLERIFEPFFTTKGVGKGTGLGLAAVYGTVKEHKGCITVHSEPGFGTTFSLFFPITRGNLCMLPQVDSGIQKGSGCILVVDDEEVIRATASSMLEDLGYTVLLASDGQEGVLIYERHMSKIDLIILDMIMPRMGGGACFQAIRKMNPQARVLISSGYTKEGSMELLWKEGISGIVKKPYRRSEVAKAVQEALASS